MSDTVILEQINKQGAEGNEALARAIEGGGSLNHMIGAILGGVMTLLLKWLLSMAVCSILLFFAVGIRNKVLASIVAVVFSVSALSLVYLAVNTAAMNVLKIEGFDLGAYMPDALMNSVNAVTGNLVVNGLVVAAVFIALFVTLTYMVFKKRDVK